MNNLSYKKILIIRFGSMGDLILTTPVIRFLKTIFQDSGIDFLTKENYKSLLLYNPMINEIFTISSNSKQNLFKVIDKLKKNNYDLVIDLHSNLRSFIVKHSLSGSQKFTYSKDIFKRRLLCNFGINLLKNKKHVVARYLETVCSIDKSIQIPTPLPLPEIYASKDIDEKIKKWLDDLNIKPDEILIGFNPGAIHFTKRWSSKRFIELGQLLKSEFKIRIFLLGGNQDELIASEIAEILGDNAIITCGKFNILETYQLLKHLRFIITGDTGIMHLSSAAHTPVIALFGPTVQEFGFWPYGKEDIIVEKNLKCRPCNIHGSANCPLFTHLCMEDISAEEILSLCIKKLNLL